MRWLYFVFGIKYQVYLPNADDYTCLHERMCTIVSRLLDGDGELSPWFKISSGVHYSEVDKL